MHDGTCSASERTHRLCMAFSIRLGQSLLSYPRLATGKMGPRSGQAAQCLSEQSCCGRKSPTPAPPRRLACPHQSVEKGGKGQRKELDQPRRVNPASFIATVCEVSDEVAGR